MQFFSLPIPPMYFFLVIRSSSCSWLVSVKSNQIFTPFSAVLRQIFFLLHLQEFRDLIQLNFSDFVYFRIYGHFCIHLYNKCDKFSNLNIFAFT